MLNEFVHLSKKRIKTNARKIQHHLVCLGANLDQFSQSSLSAVAYLLQIHAGVTVRDPFH